MNWAVCYGTEVRSYVRQPPAPPTFAPSWNVHIKPTPTGEPSNAFVETPRYSAQYGVGLEQLVSLFWRRKYNRIFVDPGLDSKGLYDVILVPPGEPTEEEKFKVLRAAVEDYFLVQVVKETRHLPVEVLRAPHGKSPGLKELSDMKTPEGFGSISGGGLGGTSRELSGGNVVMDDLCELIEGFENTLVIDETNLRGHYSIAVKGDGDFRKMLKEQLGLEITQEQRDVDVLRIAKR